MRSAFITLFFAAMLGTVISCAIDKSVVTILTPTTIRSSIGKLDGKKVTLVAWIVLESEDANLWTSREDMTNIRSIHCISLEKFDQFWKQRSRLSRHRVQVTGTVREDVVGDSGTIRFAACSRSAIEPISISILPGN